MKIHALAFVLAASAAAHAQAPLARQVAAPASDILAGIVRLPDPASTPSASSAALFPLHFVRAASGIWSTELSYPVERDGTFVLALLSPAAASWKLFAAPSGAVLRPVDGNYASERRTGFAGDSMPGWIVDRRELHGAQLGPWTLRVETTSPAEGWLLASATSELRVEAFVTTQRLIAGSPIAICARVLGREAKNVARAQAFFETDTEVREVDMRDDGLHDDGAAADGRFGAFLPEEMRGDVRARVEVSGATQLGGAFLRGVQIAFPVLEPTVWLDGSAETSLENGNNLRIAIRALPLGRDQRLHVSAEVWGHDARGNPSAVCWLSKMLEPEARAGAWILPLSLDLDWLDVAGAAAPFELRAVRVQDPDSEVVFDFAERLALATPNLRTAPVAATGALTPKLLTGNGAMTLGLSSATPPQNFAANRALMLVHGYCSSGSIWPAGDFTAPKLEFLDPNANRTHDQFAQLIAQRALTGHIASFGIVGHSQGGPAALHLLTYYASGLDRSVGGRRIQSVAAPYQGTPLASLGGFACGTNADMTPSGSATWLAGIPSWARAEVFTWTTSNSGAACNFFTGLLLVDPEDGTVEKTRGELPGGNNMGHVVGWCHTTGMTNPASYTDHARNLAMDAAASR